MTNATLLDRVARAYRPLYLHGLLLDGRYRLPTPTAPARETRRRRMLLAALTGLQHALSFNRSKR